MKDGRIVQVGTAEEIVTNPADAYVRDFVTGISRLKLVYARTIMKPITSVDGETNPLPADAVRVPQDSDLDTLINVAVTTPHPMVITAADGREVAVVSQNDLLLDIHGSTESTTENPTLDAPAKAHETNEHNVDALVDRFIGHNDNYYVPQFARLGKSADFAFSTNIMAAIFGPI
jgi:ABC-type proline/glycine betaine transport system ATPase subunit